MTELAVTELAVTELAGAVLLPGAVRTQEAAMLIYTLKCPPKFFLVVCLKAYLEKLLGCPVDIIRKHHHLNPFLLKEVEREGIEVIHLNI